MSARALCILLFVGAVAAQSGSRPKFHHTPDGPVPHPGSEDRQVENTMMPASSAAAPNSTYDQIMTTINEDLVVVEKRVGLMKNGLDEWLAESSFHRNVLLPAAVGAFSGLLTYCILWCCCKRRQSKAGYNLPHKAGHSS